VTFQKAFLECHRLSIAGIPKVINRII